jgi:hypothetical protein
MLSAITAALEDPVAAEELAEIPGPNPEEDIAESKELVASLKAAQAAQARRSDDTETGEKDPDPEQVIRKRTLRETTPPPTTITPQEPSSSTPPPRPIATNRRIQLTATQKSAAWGTLAFAVAVGAAQFLPRFF